MIDYHSASSVAFGKPEASCFKRVAERRLRVRSSPGILNSGFDLAWIAALALGLLPLFQCEIARVALMAIHQPARHGPAMLDEKLAGDIPHLQFRVR